MRIKMNNSEEDVFQRGPLLEDINAAEVRALFPLIFSYALILIIGVIGNAIVLLVYSVRYKHYPARIYILFLASIDFTICLFGLPYHLIDLTSPYTYTDELRCQILTFIIATLFYMSVFGLIVIAIDRYLKICRPLGTYQVSRFGKKRACFVAMVMAVLLSWPNLVLYGPSEMETPVGNLTGHACFFHTDYLETSYPFIYTLITLSICVLSMVALAVLYTLICHHIIVRYKGYIKYQSGGGCEDSTLTEEYNMKTITNTTPIRSSPSRSTDTNPRVTNGDEDQVTVSDKAIPVINIPCAAEESNPSSVDSNEREKLLNIPDDKTRTKEEENPIEEQELLNDDEGYSTPLIKKRNEITEDIDNKQTIKSLISDEASKNDVVKDCSEKYKEVEDLVQKNEDNKVVNERENNKKHHIVKETQIINGSDEYDENSTLICKQQDIEANKNDVDIDVSETIEDRDADDTVISITEKGAHRISTFKSFNKDNKANCVTDADGESEHLIRYERSKGSKDENNFCEIYFGRESCNQEILAGDNDIKMSLESLDDDSPNKVNHIKPAVAANKRIYELTNGRCPSNRRSLIIPRVANDKIFDRRSSDLTERKSADLKSWQKSKSLVVIRHIAGSVPQTGLVDGLRIHTSCASVSHSNRSSLKRKPSLSRQHYKITKIMLIITSIFMLSYAPALAVTIWSIVNPGFWDELTERETIICEFFLRFYLLNNVCNPFIYGFWDRRFNREVMFSLRKVYRRIISRFRK